MNPRLIYWRGHRLLNYHGRMIAGYECDGHRWFYYRTSGNNPKTGGQFSQLADVGWFLICGISLEGILMKVALPLTRPGRLLARNLPDIDVCDFSYSTQEDVDLVNSSYLHDFTSIKFSDPLSYDMCVENHMTTQSAMLHYF